MSSFGAEGEGQGRAGGRRMDERDGWHVLRVALHSVPYQPTLTYEASGCCLHVNTTLGNLTTCLHRLPRYLLPFDSRTASGVHAPTTP